MKISELQKKLDELKVEHGDIQCVVSESHEYWGSVETPVGEYNLNVANAQPEGPKSGKSEKCVIFSYS